MLVVLSGRKLRVQCEYSFCWCPLLPCTNARIGAAPGRVEDGRGSLGPKANTPFPISAHRAGRAELPHPALRLGSLQTHDEAQWVQVAERRVLRKQLRKTTGEFRALPLCAVATFAAEAVG